MMKCIQFAFVALLISSCAANIGESTDFSGLGGMLAGRDFDVLPSSRYIISGSRYEDENILSVLSEKDGTCTPLPFWPEDGCDDIPPVAKQLIYTRVARVFSNGDKVLYACGEGRYFSILDISSDKIQRHVYMMNVRSIRFFPTV